MAWTTPKSWTSSMVTSALLNIHIRDNFLALSGHVHSGSAGDGSATLSGISIAALAVPVLADTSASPDAAGELQRKGIILNGTTVRRLSVFTPTERQELLH